jgi:hypothetical protein
MSDAAAPSCAVRDVHLVAPRTSIRTFASSYVSG